ncbi:type II secretion system protein GspM [Primorskyibacter aestuariivivens]|uniref:type II secretion system protein GspM n=1 Tax=Primorskyibacter aestuariivivens TaxID=1888912 RepID=UPI002300D8C1|nr:type II secretion system protein GspM [Primorskyibacter aestuariivivens]MDA7426911.1 type II secretion system protein GspM [Primorskyibacter aestuariivivens]
MAERLIDLLLRLTGRERLLLLLLVLVALPAGLWFGVAEPLMARKAAAHAAFEEAQVLHVWVVERAQEAASLTPADEAQRADDPIGLSAIEQSLREAGLRGDVTALTNDGQGGVTLRFDSVVFQKFGAWLEGIAPQWGYSLSDLRIEATEDEARVFVELRAQPGEG